MEELCKRAEDTFKLNRLQDVSNKLELINGQLQIKVASFKDAVVKYTSSSIPDTSPQTEII